MEKKHKTKDDVCVCTPLSNWRPLHLLPQNSNSNVSARKLAAHLYKNTFPTCSQVPRHMPRSHYSSTSTHQVASCSLSDTASLSSTRIHAREPTRKVLNGMRKLKDLRTHDLNEQQESEGMVKRSILKCHVSRHCKSKSETLTTTLQALERELDDERRGRKRLESLNLKLSVEIDEVQLMVTSTLKEIEKERRSCKVLQDLCEKFAKVIIYRQSEMTSAKPRTLEELKLTCRMAESWLDKRTRTNPSHNAKFSVGLSSSPEERSLYRRSSESFLVNEHEDNSTENDLYCLEQQKWTTSSKGAWSSTGTEKCSSMKLRRMVKNLSRNYSGDISEHKQSSDVRAIFTASSSPKHQLRSNLTTSPVNQKQCSLGSYLLEARQVNALSRCRRTKLKETRTTEQ